MGEDLIAVFISLFSMCCHSSHSASNNCLCSAVETAIRQISFTREVVQIKPGANLRKSRRTVATVETYRCDSAVSFPCGKQICALGSIVGLRAGFVVPSTVSSG